MSKANEITSNSKNYFSIIIITQCICIAIILLSVFAVKYFFRGTYKQLKEWYNQKICVDTDINEVLKSDGDTDEI